ncbi:MAG: hypothetical protein NTX22_10065 [Ignavibacteriales bacterium]|nr:hypothetical protein [Ignavibacteriales bacterium]
MFKLKISSIITILIGAVSFLWTVYDYIALSNSVALYNKGQNLVDYWRNVSLGFIPIILFHISFFITMYFLFGYLKAQKEILKDYKQLKTKEDLEKKTDGLPK